jgi:outer membrane murein-binding lipoprotein Lpp
MRRSQRVRKKLVGPRVAVSVTAAVVVAGLAVSGCSSTKMGAAAITGNSRISSGNLTAQVANLNSAYVTDKAKGLKPQRATGQETQQVLTWLILFNIYDQVAAQHNIHITPAQTQKQLTGLTTEASQNKATLDEYVSAAGGVPPDLTQELGQYFAILASLESKLDGGKSPTSTSGQNALESKVGQAQCVAAKSLDVKVNPQFGEFDYSSYSVVPAPPTLAAGPSPSASSSPAVLTPPC